MLPPQDYYDYMYDVEGLTSLNVAQSEVQGKEIQEIEDLIRAQKCQEALARAASLAASSEDLVSPAHMLARALETKNILFKDAVQDAENISPKMCALRELSGFLKLSETEVEKNMVVEEPVGRDWVQRKIDPSVPESVLSFYRETDSYLYELMAANQIIQTLFTFAVMADRMNKLGIHSVLDYGGGIGTLSILLTRLGFDVTFAELPSKTADFAKWRFQKRNLSIPSVQLSGNERTDLSLPAFKNRNFDCILSTEVFEHVSKPLDLISAFSEKLSYGGVAVVSESCDYTEQFASHLEQNKQYGGKEFQNRMNDAGLRPYEVDFFIPQQIFVKG